MKRIEGIRDRNLPDTIEIERDEGPRTMINGLAGQTNLGTTAPRIAAAVACFSLASPFLALGGRSSLARLGPSASQSQSHQAPRVQVAFANRVDTTVDTDPVHQGQHDFSLTVDVSGAAIVKAEWLIDRQLDGKSCPMAPVTLAPISASQPNRLLVTQGLYYRGDIQTARLSLLDANGNTWDYDFGDVKGLDDKAALNRHLSTQNLPTPIVDPPMNDWIVPIAVAIIGAVGVVVAALIARKKRIDREELRRQDARRKDAQDQRSRLRLLLGEPQSCFWQLDRLPVNRSLQQEADAKRFADTIAKWFNENVSHFPTARQAPMNLVQSVAQQLARGDRHFIESSAGPEAVAQAWQSLTAYGEELTAELHGE